MSQFKAQFARVGTSEFVVPHDAAVEIRASSEFLVKCKSAEDDDWYIVGPDSGMDRVFVFKNTWDSVDFQIVLPKLASWNCLITPQSSRYENVDPNPVETAVMTGESLRENMREIIRQEFANMRMNDGYESEEEADDFDIDSAEEIDLSSKYELQEMEPELDPIPPQAAQDAVDYPLSGEAGGTQPSTNDPVAKPPETTSYTRPIYFEQKSDGSFVPVHLPDGPPGDKK